MQPNNHNTQMAREKNVLTSPFMTFGGRNLFGVTKRVSRKNIEALDFAFASKPKRPPISPKPHTRAQILFSVSHAKRMCSLTYKEMNQNSTSEVRTSTSNELKRRCLNLIQDSSPPSQMNEPLHISTSPGGKKECKSAVRSSKTNAYAERGGQRAYFSCG